MLRYVSFCAERSDEEMKRMAIKLTLYFEDMVSEIGLWHSFVRKHQQLYGKPLPFYHIEKNYTPDEPHIEDIQFLLWDSTLDDEYSDTLVNPENEALAHAARTVYAYFMELFEDTPINDDLYDFFHEARFTDNFYDVRQVLKWYFFDCYLTSGRFLKSTFDEALDYQMDLCRGNRQVAQSAAEASIAFRYQVGPLAMKPQEWLAALLTIHGHADKAANIATNVAKNLEPYVLEHYDRQTVTLLCMLGSEELFCHCFENSKMGRHYTYPFLIAGLAPAHHHLLAIEEGYAIHFSDGDGYGSNDIICESMDHISHRAGFPLTEVHYNHEEVPYRLLSRNRTLLIFSGKWRHGSYNLLFNNCEHFVTLCKTGRSESNQARSFFSDAFMIGLSLFTRRPQFISMVLARRLGKFFE